MTKKAPTKAMLPRQQKELELAEQAKSLPQQKKEIARLILERELEHNRKQSYLNEADEELNNAKNFNSQEHENDEKSSKQIESMTTLIAQVKKQLADTKSRIAEIEQSIVDAREDFERKKEELNQEFRKRKESILEESREVEAQLAHYTEWQKQSDTFKAHLSELKSTIHHNRVLVSEVIAETRKSSQAKIEKHRIKLAEAIRQARAESLRLRSGDISELSTTFLTQTERQVQSMQSEIESGLHLQEVNATIDNDNASMRNEIHRLKLKNQRSHDQAEKQEKVIEKLKAVRAEFQAKAAAEKKTESRSVKPREREAQVQTQPAPQEQTQQFKLTPEHEAFITFLNECATTIRSIQKQLLNGEAPVAQESTDTRFDAPKLSALISEVAALNERLGRSSVSSAVNRPTLTPAAAYFAFSAPFDETDKFIASENWSFAKYEPSKPVVTQKKPKIIRVQAGAAPPKASRGIL